MKINNKYAKYAGILYLLIAIISPIVFVYIPSKIPLDNGTAGIIDALVNNELLFRIGIGLETIIFLSEIILSVILYKIFKDINPAISLIALVSRLAMTIIQAVTTVALITIIELVTSPLINDQSIDGIIYSLFKYQASGVLIWQILFGLHLITLGYLVYKSNYISKEFGMLLILASTGYLANSYFSIFTLDSSIFTLVGAILLTISTIGEVVFMIRLLGKRIN